MQKKSSGIMLAAVLVLGLSACKKTTQSTDIITTKADLQEAPKQQLEIQEVGNYDQTVDAEWSGAVYKVEMHRVADESLPVVTDDQGNRYYDNKITVRVTRHDGSEFFARTFTKSDFASSLDGAFKSDGALLGIVFDKVEGDNLLFAASVGSPDKASDEYIPLVLKLSRSGTVSISKATTLDTTSDDNAASEKEEIEEEDGV